MLQNAFKFTVKGHITITVSYDEVGSQIKVNVKDTGIGIKDEDKDKLFELFGKLK